jgi:hypothetical protein
MVSLISMEGVTKRMTVRQQKLQIGQQRRCNYVTINLPAKDKRHQLTTGG